VGGIQLGFESDRESGFGFPSGHAPSKQNAPILFDGEGPICMIAPTGAGKGRDFLIPTILTYDGPLIVTDLKGELASVCARRRKKMGYSVAVLDPFKLTRFESARLNAFDLFNLPGALLESDAEMMASQLGEEHTIDKDLFWNDQANSLISGLIVAIQTIRDPADRNFGTLKDYLFADDVAYNLAVLLDTKGKAMPKFAYGGIAGFLQAAEQNTRPSILSTAQNYMRALCSADVERCLKDSTINLSDIIEGKPLDIFICIQPEKMKSHKCLLRLWVGTLLTAIMRRSEIPTKRTLLVADEAAQLGEFDLILTASTLLRGYGLQLITAWQDVAQIRSRYKLDTATILNNAAVLISFGQGHYAAAKEYADLMGIDAAELLKMGMDQAALSVRGEGTRIIRRMNYLKDERLARFADPNPYFARQKKGKVR
jgi:type IV secretion system protein VirD4